MTGANKNKVDILCVHTQTGRRHGEVCEQELPSFLGYVQHWKQRDEDLGLLNSGQMLLPTEPLAEDEQYGYMQRQTF